MGRSFHSTSLPSLSIHFPSARYSFPSSSFFLVSSFATISGIVLDLALVIVSANLPGGIRSMLIRPNVFFLFYLSEVEVLLEQIVQQPAVYLGRASIAGKTNGGNLSPGTLLLHLAKARVLLEVSLDD